MSEPRSAPHKGWLSPEAASAAIGTATGKGVRIAVIDSGIDTTHPALSKLKISENTTIIEQDGRIQVIADSPGDAYGHGTAVAGIIHEVAPEAEIGSFRVLDARNLSRTAIIAHGVRLAIRRGYHILNCSFGCRGSVRFIMQHKEWIDEAFLHGVHVVAACNNFDIHEPEWPGHFTSVVAVSMARTDSAYFFHRDGCMVSFAAKGEEIEVPWVGGGTKIDTGSSFAAPRVTGYLARLLSLAPGMPPAHAQDLLQRIALPLCEV
jgi:subtilisin family serine protease